LHARHQRLAQRHLSEEKYRGQEVQQKTHGADATRTATAGKIQPATLIGV
jgi:hypothetical protein